MRKFIEKNFGLVLIFFAVTAYFSPNIFTPLKDYVDEALMFSLFLGFLRVNFAEFLQIKKQFFKVSVLVSLYMFILPVIFFLGSMWMDESIRLGLFLLLAVSSAVMGPMLSELMGLRTILATVFTLFTSFLVPFSLPFLVALFFGVTVEISSIDMFYFLLRMILIPAVLGFICQRWFIKIFENLKKEAGVIGTLNMALFIATLIAVNQKVLAEGIFSSFGLESLVFLFIIYFLLYVVGYFIPGKDIQERLTQSMIFGNMNNGLVILLAAKFFSPTVFLVVLLSEIPWTLAQPVFSTFTHKKLQP